MIINYLKKCPENPDKDIYVSYNSHLNEITPVFDKNAIVSQPTPEEEKRFEKIKQDIEEIFQKKILENEGYDLLIDRGKGEERIELVVISLEDKLLQLFNISDPNEFDKKFLLVFPGKGIDPNKVDAFGFIIMSKKSNTSIIMEKLKSISREKLFTILPRAFQ